MQIVQDGKPLFLTRFTVADLVSPGFYGVNTLGAFDADGYQRVADKSRANKFAEYIREAGAHAFLPTSILLATENDLNYDAGQGQIAFEISGDKDDPFFFIVDGQHRVAGLRKVADEAPLSNEWLRSFPVAAVVAAGLGPVEQAMQFLIVNTTQRKISRDLEHRILVRFERMDGVESMPADLAPSDRKLINIGIASQAALIVDYLNKSSRSPWCEKIQVANAAKTNGVTTVRESTLAASLKSHVLKYGHPVVFEDDADKRNKMIENYWRAIAARFLPPGADAKTQDIPLFKTVGIDIFHQASMAVFNHLAMKGRDYTEEGFREVLDSASAQMEDECADMFNSPRFWARGRDEKAAGGNKSMSRKYATALEQAVNRISGGSGE